MKRFALLLAATLIATLAVVLAHREAPPRVRSAEAATPPAALPALSPWPAPVVSTAPGRREDGARPRFCGTVVDAVTGVPVDDVTVRLCCRVGEDLPFCEEQDQVGFELTRDDGTFSVEVEAPGSNKDEDSAAGHNATCDTPSFIALWHPGYHVEVVDSFALEEARSGSPTLLLYPEPSVTGRLLLPSGEVARTGVVAWRPAGQRILRGHHYTDDGTYDLHYEMAEGVIVIEARTGGPGDSSRFGTASITLRDGERRNLDIVLDRPILGVRGRLLDGQGRPVSLVRVAPEGTPIDTDDRGSLLQQADTSGGDGSFVLEFEHPGPHQLRFTSMTTLAQAVLEARSFVAVESVARSAPLPIVGIARPGLVACSLVGSDSSPAPLVRWSIRGPSGELGGETFCECQGKQLPEFLHFLWPDAGGPVVVSLVNYDVGGRATLREPSDPCMVAGSPDEGVRAHMRRRRTQAEQAAGAED